MATNNNGIIYYKLDSYVHGYPGDITKNCGLRGEEIDGNFNFLRGNDIESVSFDVNGTIHLKKMNGEILTAKPTEAPEYDFNYNPESGSLTIVTPGGKEVVLTGFKVTTNVYHDFTMKGHGSQETPLEVSNIAKTGRYRPAIKLIDTTILDENGESIEQLPEDENEFHDRYVTKEKISRFGRLFPLRGVELISERLKEISSEWHVPTKEEWDEILNVIDCANPNHNSTESNVELGEFAGLALKGIKYWDSFNNEVLSDDQFGFSIYPVGYCGNRGTNYYGSFGQTAAFWTSSVEDNHKDMFVKTFNYDSEKVGQNTWGDNYYLSLRLVKKFTGNNLNDSESIDGFTSTCVHIPGTSLIWTRENIAFSQTQYEGFVPDKWHDYENTENDENSFVIRYFVNDWNGTGWDKHELKEGEGIVLYEGDNGRMHEWLLVDGELIDTAVLLKSEFEKELEYIHGRIDKEAEVREDVDNQLWEAINNESKIREQIDNQQWDAINNETIARQEVDKDLWDAINNEIDARLQVESDLWKAINDEAVTRQNTDTQLFDAITAETNRAQEIEAQLWQGLNGETERAQNVESDLWKAINDEANRAQNVEGQLWNELNNEIENRKNEDANLQRQINENKVTPEDNSVVIEAGSTDGNNVTTPTTIKVNLDSTCEHIKLGENGIYFDGYFGQF